MLPPIKQVIPQLESLPTHWQTAILRNYRLVPTERIARVLACTEEQVHKEAERMGLRRGEADPRWLTEGYITLIRNNWYLFPYEQLLELLQWDEARLDYSLAKDDFLSTKLGRMKPDCERVVYAPLTEEQIAQTEQVARTIRHDDTSDRAYFNFFPPSDKPAVITHRQGKSMRMVHGYLTPCGDAFLEDTRSHLPDELLDMRNAASICSLFMAYWLRSRPILLIPRSAAIIPSAALICAIWWSGQGNAELKSASISMSLARFPCLGLVHVFLPRQWDTV